MFKKQTMNCTALQLCCINMHASRFTVRETCRTWQKPVSVTPVLTSV